MTLDEYMALTVHDGPVGHVDLQQTVGYRGAREYLQCMGMPVSEIVDVILARGEDFDGRKHLTVTIQALLPPGAADA